MTRVYLQRIGRHLAYELTLANAASIVRNNLMLEYVFPACMLMTLSDDLSILAGCPRYARAPLYV